MLEGVKERLVVGWVGLDHVDEHPYDLGIELGPGAASELGQRGLDPDRLSFTHAVRVIKRKMPQAAAVPP